jgi:hypothetical protein
MFSTTIITLAVLSLLIGAPIAVAEHDHKWHDSHGGHSEHAVHSEHATHSVYNGIHLPSDQFLADGGCSEQEIKSLHKLHERLAKDSADREKTLAEAEEKMIKTRDSARVSESVLHDAIEDYFTAKSDLMKLRATAAVEARKIMGDELFEKIAASHR